ncbi:MAG: hypothetical protein F4X92_00040 [Gammaproteobacteria bacterium]|nr:hypothetical protein [Gammaproteobacteria bacterium]
MNRPSVEQVSELLETDHFGTGDGADAGPSATGDPVADSVIRLNLDQIHEFDRNPRRAPNAEYDLLKASLFKTGAARVLLVVTRRPGEDEYFPAAGGNTRLRILKELYAEFRDEKYYWINCKFTPYRNDVVLMIDHLSENDHRSEYIYIDRARAICELYDQMSWDAGGELSQLKFIEQLMDMGYPGLGRTTFQRYQLVASLYEHIPRALDAGMGKRAIDRLNDFRITLESFIARASRSDAEVSERLESLFHVTLSENDSEEGIDHAAVASDLFALLAPGMERYAPGTSTEEITALLTKLFSRYQQNTDVNVSLENRRLEPVTQYRPERPGPVQHIYTGAESDGSGQGYDSEADSTEDDIVSFPSPAPLQDTEFVPEPDPGEPDHPPSGGRPPAGDRQQRYVQLLDHAHDCAKRLAQAHGLGQLVQKFDLPMGYGYWVELPAGNLDRTTATTWWWLFELSAIAQPLVEDPDLVYPDPEFGNSQFAAMYRQVEQGRGGISLAELDQLPDKKQRNETVYCQALRVIENQVPRYHDHVRYLADVPDPQYGLVTSLLNAYRAINRHRTTPDDGQ